MGYAKILTTAFKANATGGTFADTLAANSGDSLSVNNYSTPDNSSASRITDAWGIDSDSACEFSYYYTRPESTFDQNFGIRAQVPALYPGGAAAVGAHNLLPGQAHVPTFSGDTLTIKASATAADDLVFSFLMEYDDLPGANMQFITWEQCQSLRSSQFGNYVNPTGGTAGVYGTGRALTADDNRFHAQRWYAILGFTTETPFTTLALSGPTLSGFKYGAPAGVLNLDTTWWFVEQSKISGKPCIPYFGQADGANTNVYVADGEASTAPKIDFHYYELASEPNPGA